MSSWDMSLDEIIKLQRQEARAKRNIEHRPQKFKPVPILNARYKNISYNRTCLTDARQKLTQLAQQKLNKTRQERETTFVPVRNTYPTSVFARPPPSAEINPSRRVPAQPLGTATSYTTHSGGLQCQIFNEARPKPYDPSRRVTAQPLGTATSYTIHNGGLQCQIFNEARPKPYEYQYTPIPKREPCHTAVAWDLSMKKPEEEDEAPKDEDNVPQPPLLMNESRPNMEYSYESRATGGYTNSVKAFQRTVQPEKTTSAEETTKKNSAAAVISDLIRRKSIKTRLGYKIIISNLSPTASEFDI